MRKDAAIKQHLLKESKNRLVLYNQRKTAALITGRPIDKDMPMPQGYDSRIRKRQKVGPGGRMSKGKRAENNVVNKLITIADILDKQRENRVANKIDKILRKIASS